MSPIFLKFLDILLYLAHIVVIGFNLVGWIWPQTRKWHLISVVLTALSWFVLGIWYGFGYCFLTDWQWDIKRRLGKYDLPASFIDHFVNQVLEMSISSSLIDYLTGIFFMLAAVISIVLYFKGRKNQLHE